MPSNNTQDARTLISILSRHKSWFAGFVALCVSSSGGLFWVYSHFAKHSELVQTRCERQAEDKDIKNRIEVAKAEAVVIYANSVLEIFEKLDPEGNEISTRVWGREFRNLKDEYQEKSDAIKRIPRYNKFDVIDECTHKAPHVIKDHSSQSFGAN